MKIRIVKNIVLSIHILTLLLILYIKYSLDILTNSNSFIVILALVLFISFNKKVFWFFGLFFYLYGVYILLFESVYLEESSMMDFTSSITSYLRIIQLDFLSKLTRFYPLIYFSLFTILSFVKPVRKYYGLIK